MKKSKIIVAASTLRQKAEEQLKKKPSKFGSQYAEAEMMKTIHELEVHQIELEMQNDELILAKEQADAAKKRFTELYNFAPSGFFTLTKEGEIIEENLYGSKMLNYKSANLKKSMFSFFISNDSKPIFNLFLKKVFNGRTIESCDVILSQEINPTIYVHLTGRVTENGEQCLLTAVDISEHKRFENALINSEANLHLLVQTIPDLIWTKDADGIYLSCNTMFERFFGASEADIIGKTDYDFVDQKLADFFRENDKIAMAAGKPTSNEEWVTFADDGHRACLETIKAPMFDAQNKLIGVLGIGRDITDRNSAEQKVKESEKRFRAIFSQAPIGIALLDLQGQLIVANSPLSEMVGYACDELSKKNFADFTFPEDLYKELEQLDDLISGKISMYSMEKRYIHKNGHLIWANLFVTILRDENGNFQEILGMVEDITERKQAEEKLMDNNIFLQTLLNAIPTPVFYKDLDGHFIGFNKAFEQFYGKTRIELIGKTIFEIASPELAEIHHVKDMELFKNQGVLIYDSQLKDNQGIIHDVVNHKAVILDSKEQVSGLVGVVLDITERKKADDEIREKNAFIQTVLDNLPIGIALNKIDSGSAFYVNKKFEEIYGWPKDEMKDIAGFFEKVYPDKKYREELAIRIQTDMQSGDSSRMHWEDCTITHKDGSTHTINAVNIPLFDQNTMVSTVLDITERKLAEIQLSDSEERYRSFFENSMDAILLTSPGGSTLSANEAACIMFGYSKDELIKLGRSGVVDTSDRRLAVLLAERKLNGKAHGEITLIRKDGTHFPAELSTAVFTSAEGYERTSMIIHDITERMNAQKEITMLAQSLKSVNELVSITDTDNKILFVNDSFLKTYGYLLPELIGENISLILSEKNVREKVDEILPSTILGEWKGELINTRKDGSEFPVYLSTSIIKDKDGKSLGLIGVAIDITERKRNEQTLLKLSSAVEQTIDLIVITDHNGSIEYVNRAFEKLTGYSSNEVMGKTPRILKSGDKSQEFYEGLWKTILSGNVFRTEMLNKKKNGDLYYEEKSISPILDKNSKITHFVSTGLDITERKRAEKELIEAKNKAEENDKLKTAFLQNMSHEIRTPMNAIVGFSELMEIEINEPEKLKYYTKIIRQRSDDLLGIINELLDISRIESGQLSFKSEQVDLNKLFEEQRSFFAEHKLQDEKSSIQLLVKEIPALFNSIVSTDIGKLKQIFSNLIHNAFKFTTEGKIEFGFHSISNNKITFFVSDSGVGISENMKELIFERFRKSADESVYVQDGMGLGLAIVKGLLKLFNGAIWVESVLKEGTTFYFTIPYLPISAKTTSEKIAKSQNYDWSKFKLLIVEDDKFNIAYFEEILESTGIHLLIGETGNQAISLFTNNQNIDLVLMDIKLPDMSGYEVTKEFKKVRPEIPIIAQTAFAAMADRQRALDVGCDDFITKPIKHNIFLETIGRYLISK